MLCRHDRLEQQQQHHHHLRHVCLRNVAHTSFLLPPPCPHNSSPFQIRLLILLVFPIVFLNVPSPSEPRAFCPSLNTSPCGSSQELQTTSLQVSQRISSPSFQLNVTLAMIFLKDNVLLEHNLIPEMIKPRLLGHWGTCPGLVLVYAHLNRIIRNTGLSVLYVVGPGK